MREIIVIVHRYKTWWSHPFSLKPAAIYSKTLPISAAYDARKKNNSTSNELKLIQFWSCWKRYLHIPFRLCFKVVLEQEYPYKTSLICMWINLQVKHGWLRIVCRKTRWHGGNSQLGNTLFFLKSPRGLKGEIESFFSLVIFELSCAIKKHFVR